MRGISRCAAYQRDPETCAANRRTVVACLLKQCDRTATIGGKAGATPLDDGSQLGARISDAFDTGAVEQDRGGSLVAKDVRADCNALGEAHAGRRIAGVTRGAKAPRLERGGITCD